MAQMLVAIFALLVIVVISFMVGYAVGSSKAKKVLSANPTPSAPSAPGAPAGNKPVWE